MSAAPLHFKLESRSRLCRCWQHEIEHLPGDLDLGAAIGRRADHLRLKNLPSLQSQ